MELKEASGEPTLDGVSLRLSHAAFLRHRTLPIVVFNVTELPQARLWARSIPPIVLTTLTPNTDAIPSANLTLTLTLTLPQPAVTLIESLGARVTSLEPSITVPEEFHSHLLQWPFSSQRGEPSVPYRCTTDALHAREGRSCSVHVPCSMCPAACALHVHHVHMHMRTLHAPCRSDGDASVRTVCEARRVGSDAVVQGTNPIP